MSNSTYIRSSNAGLHCVIATSFSERILARLIIWGLTARSLFETSSVQQCRLTQLGSRKRQSPMQYWYDWGACVCVLKRGVSREDAGEGWEVRSPFLFFFFLLSGVAELSGGSPQRPPSLPLLQNKRGFFSEEHSDVGGGCECGPCVRAAAAAAVSASPPQLWCLCKPTELSSLTYHNYIFVQTCVDACLFFESVSFKRGIKVAWLKTRWVIWGLHWNAMLQAPSHNCEIKFSCKGNAYSHQPWLLWNCGLVTLSQSCGACSHCFSPVKLLYR